MSHLLVVEWITIIFSKKDRAIRQYCELLDINICGECVQHLDIDTSRTCFKRSLPESAFIYLYLVQVYISYCFHLLLTKPDFGIQQIKLTCIHIICKKNWSVITCNVRFSSIIIKNIISDKINNSKINYTDPWYTVHWSL